ncbi:uncharacterized protein LOC126833555 [Adelges cooleyi]|uniref:uncharacterized protein LOC126833555 n=1 Tax=Adelges cooleyi TaxID=133065 RepID=UPI0021808E36|nr:uncharacterized protein LOC126833555 [Adelges cooleyi]
MDLCSSDVSLKQNKNNSSHRSKTSPSNPKASTIIAKAVTVYKLEISSPSLVGKYGLALAGDKKLNYYQILIYGKNVCLVNQVLSKDFVFKVCENNHVEFQSSEKWRLEFANTNDAIEFNSHIALVLWKLYDSKALFWFDLYYPIRTDITAKLSSVVEIIYTANTIQGKILGPEVSNNIKDDKNLKVSIGKNGWERSLMGVNIGTRRIIYIPVSEMGAWKILTDGHQSLCLTITVRNVYEIKENNKVEGPLTDTHQDVAANEPRNIENEILPKKENDNQNCADTVTISKKLSIEILSDELNRLKIEHSKTNERLEKLESLVNKTNSNTTIDSAKNIDIELKKSLKFVYKSLVQKFPAEQTFSGKEIQSIIKDIFCNVINCPTPSSI